jgi:L-2,4-diaminobutyrate decarboxylase
MLRQTISEEEATVLAALEADAEPAAAAAFVDAVARYYTDAWRGAGAVSPAPPPAGLRALFAQPPRGGRPLEDVARQVVEDVVAHSNRLAHPMAMGHQVSPPLPASVWVEPLISALNQSLAVREMSPAGTAIEHSLIDWLAGLAGLGPAAGGSFTSGGTEANYTALLAARTAAMPDAWRTGVGASPPVLVCGEHAHYSVARAAGQLGIGTSSIVTVPTREWRLDAAALPGVLDAINRDGRRVMAVVASAGSTATGSFDKLAPIAAECGARGIWLHVDAAHGGSALLSGRHRRLLDGIEHADSMAWDPHKMMLLPIPCSVVLVRDERRLDAAFAQAAPYLFRGGSAERCEDQGVRSFSCSRRFEALKLWVALQRYGSDGMAALYDRLCRMAAALHERVVDHPAFEALHQPESNILCFRWTGCDHDDSAADMDARNLDLRDRWNSAGHGWITTTLLGGKRVLRVTIMNPRTTEAELDTLLTGLAALGSEPHAGQP